MIVSGDWVVIQGERLVPGTGVTSIGRNRLQTVVELSWFFCEIESGARR